jgi:CheY-like chemotaxis protein/anti-sigma regulatory factor (Ser/Thr protein kinase)
LTSAIEAARPHLESRDQQLDLVLAEEQVEVQGDLSRLAQVFSNLLNNASKYSGRGARIRVVLTREHENAVVRIIDTGLGLSSDQLPQIFEMFAQVDQPSGKEAGGLGVGLWLAKTFVTLHHGTLEARSEGRNRGSEFIVTLPLAPDRADASVPAAHIVNETGPARRILVADDNEDAATMLAETLRLASHDVRVAHHGESACRVATDFRPEVAILDIGMPVMDGYEVAIRLRKQFGSAIRLLALTGWGQEVDRLRAAEAGFDRHLTKPVDIGELHRAINPPETGDQTRVPATNES